MDKQPAREEGWNVGSEKSADINPEEWRITLHQESYSNSYEISENERKWLSSLENSPAAIGSCEKSKIQMVPKMHRDSESNFRCYEPLVVALGPFHHGKSRLQPMEKYKVLLANQFAKESSKAKSISIDALYTRVKDIVPSARDCYAEDITKYYSDEEFAKLMFLDGCFILQYIYCLVNSDSYNQLQMKSHDIAFIRRDLFLLENQLPFEVLHVLMTCRFKKDEGMEMIKKFISNAHAKPDLQSHGFIQTIKYLFLDFFCKISEREKPSLTQEESSKNQVPAHLLEILRMQLIDPKAFSKGESNGRGGWCSYRSARELSRAGIHFECGKRRCLSDIKFNSFRFSALLTLPPITIDDSTKSELLNLVAYEACPDTPDDFGVTSYICLMDSLIDHAEDVKELRSKGILLNFLGSDQEVANLFNEIATDLVPNPHAFIDVKHKIEDHYNNKGKVWVAEWKNTHFNTPWTVVAFIAAIFLILLQLADTVLAGFQVKFAKPPN